MRKFFVILFAVVLCVSSSNAGIIYVPANASDNAKLSVENTIEKVKLSSMDAFLSLTPAKIQEMTGRKMTFPQKVALKMAQKKLKKDAVSGKKSIDFKDKKQMLRLWIIFALVAIILSVLGWFVPFLWYISGLAWLASLIFFILWIVALSA